jgi:hypothetical protein
MKTVKLIAIAAMAVVSACNPGGISKHNHNKITVAAYYFPNYHTDDPRNIINKGSGWSEWELVKEIGRAHV